MSPINPTSSVRSFRPSLLRFAETTVKADYNRSRLQPLPHTQDCLDYCTSFARATLIPSRSSLCNAARHTTACYLQSKASQHSGHRPPADFITVPARQRCPHAGPLAAVQQRVDGDRLPIFQFSFLTVFQSTRKFCTTIPSLSTSTLCGMYLMPYSGGALLASGRQVVMPRWATKRRASSTPLRLTRSRFSLPAYFGLRAAASSSTPAGPHAGQND